MQDEAHEKLRARVNEVSRQVVAMLDEEFELQAVRVVVAVDGDKDHHHRPDKKKQPVVVASAGRMSSCGACGIGLLAAVDGAMTVEARRFMDEMKRAGWNLPDLLPSITAARIAAAIDCDDDHEVRQFVDYTSRVTQPAIEAP